MNLRTLAIMLAYCLMNRFCILLVSAEEDDTHQIPPTIVTSAQKQDSIEITKDEGSPSEANGTYPEEEDRLQDMQEPPLEGNARPSADDVEKTSQYVEADHLEMEEHFGEGTPGMADERHQEEDIGTGHDNEEFSVADATHEEEPIENSQAERQESHDTVPAGASDGDNESLATIEGETEEESNDTIAAIEEELGDENEDSREPVESTDEFYEEVEIHPSTDHDTADETISMSPEQTSDTENTEHIGEQEDYAAMEENQGAGEVDDQTEPSNDTEQDDGDAMTPSTMPTEMEPETIDVEEEEAIGDVIDLDSASSTAEESVREEIHGDMEHTSDDQTEPSADTEQDDRTDTSSIMTSEMESETIGIGEEEAIGDVIDLDVESPTANESDLKEIHEETEDSSDSIVEHKMVDDGSGEGAMDERLMNGRDVGTEVMDSPSMHEESTEPANPNREVIESREEIANEQITPKDGSEGPSYRGMWGTPMLGARPPDMELLYSVFESRIQKQLGIGPIPESELRENIFPLGMGFGEEATADVEAEQDDNDVFPLAQAKLKAAQSAGDVNSDFVEGLDDIDKFFEGVDPPDELDVGAAGSSMQDMLMKKGKEILIKRFRMGVKFIRQGFMAAKGKISARLSELKEKDIDFQVIAKTAWSRTLQTYEAMVGFVDEVLDFGSDDAAAKDFEAFKKMTMEDLQGQDLTPDR